MKDISHLTPEVLAYMSDHEGDSRVGRVIAITTTTIVVCLLTTIVRIVARKVRHLDILWDDWTMIGCTVS